MKTPYVVIELTTGQAQYIKYLLNESESKCKIILDKDYETDYMKVIAKEELKGLEKMEKIIVKGLRRQRDERSKAIKKADKEANKKTK